MEIPLDTSGENSPGDHLRHVVVTLDGLLTGKPLDAARNARQQLHLFTDPIHFIEAVNQSTYYLADGGYSRLIVTDEGEVALESVSRAAVKARWQDPDVQAAVAALVALLRDAIQSL